MTILNRKKNSSFAQLSPERVESVLDTFEQQHRKKNEGQFAHVDRINILSSISNKSLPLDEIYRFKRT